VLRYQLISAVQQYPRATTLVFYLGAGAPESELPPREFAPPAGSVNGGAVLGYGTSADENTLRGVADQLGGPYIARSDSTPLNADLPDGGATEDQTAAVASANTGTETYWLAALGAAVLILIELYLVLRDLRRNRVVSVEVAT
jgi:LPXTG-motif cell wall-anchored protein